MLFIRLFTFGLLVAFLCLPALAQFQAPAVDEENNAPPSDAKKNLNNQVERAADQEEVEDGEFLRVLRGNDGKPTSLETSIVRYVSTDPQQQDVAVTLIGVVHVGDRGYYSKLNKEFEKYDAVLYELVAPEGTRIPKGGGDRGASNPLMFLQTGLTGILELEHQLKHIDYTKENLIHADMSPEEFAQSMKDRGEGIVQIMLRVLEQSFAEQARQEEAGRELPQIDLFSLLFAPDRAVRLKRIFADQFENMEQSMAMFEGPNGSTIITERNKKALSVLSRELDAGKKNIAIFYGAGHLADMEERLVEEFSMKRDGEKWLTAWDLN